MRFGVRSLLLILAGPSTAIAQQSTGRIAVGTGRDIHAQIEIQRTTYALGDTACVRITLVNTSDRPVGYEAMGVSDMVHLVIKHNGRLLRPNSRPNGSATVVTAGFQPHAVRPLANGQWVPITFWGYKLDEAGGYTIEGIPQIWSGYRESVSDTTTIRSNQIAFTLSGGSSPHVSCDNKLEGRTKPNKLTPAEVRTLSDSLRTTTMEKFRAMVDTANWRNDTTVK